uniref:Uncharacterized protein n=1 Tax=Anopheles epiroticus TaxID=199890 RepID=A0A182PYK6_9DIPT
MAMVVSGRAKAVIAAFVCFFLLGIVLVTGSTKGWFVPMRYNERVAARVQLLGGGGKAPLPHSVCEFSVQRPGMNQGRIPTAGQRSQAISASCPACLLKMKALTVVL